MLDKMYSLKEIALIPKSISEINSRKEICPFDKNGRLPIFVAPMTCLVNDYNLYQYTDANVYPIYPVYFNNEQQTNYLMKAGKWVALTLEQFKNNFCECNASKEVSPGWYKVLIDVANGHMLQIYDLVSNAKQKYGDKLIVMIGNIANPETYIECCNAGVDYVRVGIGGNINCETGSKTGFHVSLPYLLTHINNLKQSYNQTKVIADGGVNTISKAIKCLALGADYVMMGTMFAKCDGLIKDKETNEYNYGFNKYYGQASSQGIIDRKGKDFYLSNRYTEGSSSRIVTTYGSVDRFTEEFENTLRSAMSYAGAKTLNDFIGRVEYGIQTETEYNSFNK